MAPAGEVIWLFGNSPKNDSETKKTEIREPKFEVRDDEVQTARERSVNESISRHPSSTGKIRQAEDHRELFDDPELDDLLTTTRKARVAALSIVEDSSVVEDDSEDVAEPDARSIAEKALARRALSSAEVRRIMIRAQVRPESADSVLFRLEQDGVLNDNALAERIVEQLTDRKRLGNSGIVQKLKERLIDPDVINTVMAEVPEDAELDNAIELATRKSYSLNSVDYKVAERRLWGHLQRKGFSSQVIRAAVETALSEHSR